MVLERPLLKYSRAKSMAKSSKYFLLLRIKPTSSPMIRVLWFGESLQTSRSTRLTLTLVRLLRLSAMMKHLSLLATWLVS